MNGAVSRSLPNPKTLALYRRMLKSMMTIFRGDPEMFHRCRLQVRGQILETRDETDPAKINEQIF